LPLRTNPLALVTACSSIEVDIGSSLDRTETVSDLENRRKRWKGGTSGASVYGSNRIMNRASEPWSRVDTGLLHVSSIDLRGLGSTKESTTEIVKCRYGDKYKKYGSSAQVCSISVASRTLLVPIASYTSIMLYRRRDNTSSISLVIFLLLAIINDYTSFSNDRNSTWGVYKLERRDCTRASVAHD
jgi:hypothetical protein